MSSEIRLSFPDEIVRVVGVSHYQDALIEITGRAGADHVRHPGKATLQPEPDNPHDPNAIRVLVDDRHVGYLSREDAVRYGPAVKLLNENGSVIACDAVIAGGGPDATTDNLGVFLELPRAPEALMEAQMHVRAGS